MILPKEHSTPVTVKSDQVTFFYITVYAKFLFVFSYYNAMKGFIFSAIVQNCINSPYQTSARYISIGLDF